MRDLLRNKRPLYYANVQSESPILDANGNDTGETDVVYQDPVFARYSVSSATGEAAAQAFGSFTDYSRVISISSPVTPFKIGTRVWFGADPSTSGNNYTVVRVADSLNSTLVALKEVVV